MFELDARLSAAASFVRRGKRVCDVGTDHGYLAVFLLKEGMVPFVTACDVNEKPLQAAKAHAKQYDVLDRIGFILSDGLQAVPSENAEDIVICGMGGELIASIIGACSYIKEGDRRLILQPMTQIPFLRRYLLTNGFVIEREKAVCDRHHCYTVMMCRYADSPTAPDELFCHTGMLPFEKTAESYQYLEREAQRLARIAAGVEKSNPQDERVQHCRMLAQQIQALLKGWKQNEQTAE